MWLETPAATWLSQPPKYPGSRELLPGPPLDEDVIFFRSQPAAGSHQISGRDRDQRVKVPIADDYKKSTLLVLLSLLLKCERNLDTEGGRRV